MQFNELASQIDQSNTRHIDRSCTADIEVAKIRNGLLYKTVQRNNRDAAILQCLHLINKNFHNNMIQYIKKLNTHILYYKAKVFNKMLQLLSNAAAKNERLNFKFSVHTKKQLRL